MGDVSVRSQNLEKQNPARFTGREVVQIGYAI
jgi:hypothetical protein